MVNITAARNIANNIIKIKKYFPKYLKTQEHSKAYSLIECLIILFIFSIIVAISSYSFILHRDNMDKKLTLEKLSNTLLFAKHYAIKNNKNIYICGSENFQNCAENWSKGIIIADLNNTLIKIIKLNAKGKLQLKIFAPYENKIYISNNGTTINNGHFKYSNYMNSGEASYIYWNNRLKIHY